MILFGIGMDKSVVSLDWDSRMLRAVEWRIGQGRVRVVKCVSAPLTPDVQVHNSLSLGMFIRRILLAERIRTTSVLVDVTRDQAILNTMLLPSVGLNDLAGMVQLQIAKELPFALTDAVVDFAVGRKEEKSNTVDVLVAAIRTEVLEFYRNVCRQAGLRLERVGLRPYANKAAVGDMLGDADAGRVLFIDVGPASTEIGVIHEGHLVFSRVAMVQLDESPEGFAPESPNEPMGSERRDVRHLETSDDVLRRRGRIGHLVVEVTRSVEAYRSTDPGARFDHVVVAGDTGLESDLVTTLTQRLGVTARRYVPSEDIGLTRAQCEGMTAFSAAIGLGIGHASRTNLQFDFLHPKKPLNAAARRRQKLPWIGAAAGVLILLSVSAYGLGIRPIRQENERLANEIKLLQEESAKYEKPMSVLDGIGQWKQEQLVWPEELKCLYEVFPSGPKEAYIKSMKLNQTRGEIEIEIAARTDEIIRNLETQLKAVMRETEVKGEQKPVFKVGGYRTNNDNREPDYPFTTTMTVTSTRISELKEKQETQGKGRKPH